MNDTPEPADECRMWIWRNGLSHTYGNATVGIQCGRRKPVSEPCCDWCKNRLSEEAIDAFCEIGEAVFVARTYAQSRAALRRVEGMGMVFDVQPIRWPLCQVRRIK